MSDLIERLRHAAFVRFHDGWESYTLAADAATRIETLERKVEELRASRDRHDAMLDSQYRAGAKAGWNAAQLPDDQANAAIAALIKVNPGDLAAIRRVKPSEAEGRKG